MKYIFCVLLVLSGGMAYAQLDKTSLGAFLRRIVKDKAAQFEVEYLAQEGGKDVFELEGQGTRIVLRGSNGLSVASALNYYLKNYCHHLITWNGAPAPLPGVLPSVRKKVHRSTPYQYRYYLNYCTFQYSIAWWDWDRWQREIDWMALNGINMPLALTGEEAIWQEVYREMGFRDQELDRFFSGPAYFSWLWMGNIDAWGGPLPAHWKDSHAALQKKILQAERAFGMKPVLPAFTGHVPPSFKDRFPAAKVKKTNWDAGFDDVYILDPSDPMFETIGKKFIEAQTRAFGTDHFYSADTFNENVPPTSDSMYLDGMSRKVYASMAEADPKAVWVMQGWMFHYNAAYWKPTQIQALLKAVPDDHMIMLDLYSESHPVWNRTEAYYGKPWIWNMLHNFGGNISLWGRMKHAAGDPSKALHDPAAGRMTGIGLTPEGIEQNPALYQLMLENVWQDGPVDLKGWLRDYALQRYGVSDKAVDTAWDLLEGSVYSGGLTEGGMESIIQARPTLEPAVERVNTHLSYDPAVLQRAWKIFVQAAPRLQGSDGYRYDLVDITRQVLANYASVLQQRFAAAWKEKDTAAFRRNSRQFLALMDDMDRVLATRRDFLLGKWIREARACGVTPDEADLYEKNARDLVTLWGDKESGLREYSCRQWSGLISGYYKPRWEMFFRRMEKALAGGQEPDLKAFDKEVKDWEWKWVNNHDAYDDEVKGDAVRVATAVYKKYFAAMQEPVATNDHIFPAAAPAKPYIDMDSKGFLVNGRRTFLVSAGLEYARIPHELWQDRLLRLQRAGFNCIEIYTFWNWHEPQEGKFDFSGDHDLGAFLRLVKSMGLYAIVRVGPYYCAEWDNGGYPLWLRFKPGVRVREDNVAFERYVDRFFDKLLPIVCGQQIHRGGAVILVQLENEHNKGWGTYMPDGYFRHLQRKALSMGMEVPYFFSGLHHASDPAGDGGIAAGGKGDAAGLDDPARPNPWMSTEFWSVWYNAYGSTEQDAREYARRTWKVLAHGGNGYNYYMAHGGSNFGYTNNDEDAASYDYGAAVGQAGDLRPIYYSFKKAAWFARSMADILENSEDATDAWKDVCKDSLIKVTARHSPAGDLLFADNPSGAARKMQINVGGAVTLPAQGALTIGPGEIVPVIHNVSVAPGVVLEWGPVRLLGIHRQGTFTTMVIYGGEGTPAELYFSVKGKVGNVVFKDLFRGGDSASTYVFSVGGQKIRIIAMNEVLADRTWFVGKGVIVGPGYVGQMQGASFLAEQAWQDKQEFPVRMFDGNGERWLTKDKMPEHRELRTLTLSGWQVKKMTVPKGSDKWLLSASPKQMGSDGNGTPWAWYTSQVEIKEDGSYTLQVEGGDRATVFVDGEPVTRINLHDGEAPLTLSKGMHTLVLFTAHDGRDKLAGFMGDMSDVDSKGLTGAARLVKGGPLRHTLRDWKYSKDGKEGWKDYTIGQDVFSKQQGTGWFRTVLPELPAGITKGQLVFRSVDENATVYLNGRQLSRHEGWNIPFKVQLDGLDTMTRPLTLTIFIENYSNEGGIDQPVKLDYLSEAKEITGWRMCGGFGDTAGVGYADINGRDTMIPRFYRSTFDAPVHSPGDHLIWRVSTQGLGHGSVWVNGHNLGRFPEKIPAPGLYIPECWMKEGRNELLIFEEDGKGPGGVTIASELEASREIIKYKSAQSRDLLSYVDPFIGTAKSDVYTRWGNEGGTYPGAAAPWGAMQLTPETRATGGYDYQDSTIFFFSCLHHMSGYPNGSAGRMKVMPVLTGMGERKLFRHADEAADPGYYKVRFVDNTIVEATASERVGIFRMSFPSGAAAKVFIGGIGKIIRRSPLLLYGSDGVVVQFDRASSAEQEVEDGVLLSFAAGTSAVLIRVSASSVSEAGALDNINKETGGLGFDAVREKTRINWRKQLSVIEVDDEKEDRKKIFYTALYHAALLPWIISDADGRYKGRDGLIHQASGQREYGGFSAWDTFRSLHPLLCLLFPQQQRDMVLSLLDIYRQTGHLPLDPMTGNHAVAVIADSWGRGIRGYDSIEAYAAMRKGVIDTPYLQDDREIYRQLGYIPPTYPESVTRTVEYAYDDWVIAWFGGKKDQGYNYRRLFDPNKLFILPGNGERGNSGYKEGDKWVYSYFAPQHPEDLVNLMGGKEEFTERLDAALAHQDILFDNETVFHIPYLFNYSGRPDKTQEWVSCIRDRRFASTPGGLPGNDDLGSMSSWYVFSALGFYPVCPGRPLYDVGTPLFRKVTVHLAGGRELVLRAPGVSPRNKYVRGIRLNERTHESLMLAHELVAKGGEIVFEMDSLAVPPVVEKSAFSFSDIAVTATKLMSDEPFHVRWSVTNRGKLATRIVRLRVNGRRYISKNCLVSSGATVIDSMECRLYALGKASLEIEGSGWQQELEVVKEGPVKEEITGLFVRPLVSAGKAADARFYVRNTGGTVRAAIVPVAVNGKVVRTDSVTLQPGEQRGMSLELPVLPSGWQEVRVGGEGGRMKVYDRPEESLLLDLSASGKDSSGFGHDGSQVGKGCPLFGKDCFIELSNAGTLDEMGSTMTMMAWVCPTERGEGLVDIFAKGDNHVLQVSGNRELTFFAGGWGRGDCTVKLPEDWIGHWHHIAGVCEGTVLHIYIDGVLKGTAKVEGPVNLTVANRWTLGRNEEFPGQRVFNGYIDKAKVFTEPLTGEAIRATMGDHH